MEARPRNGVGALQNGPEEHPRDPAAAEMGSAEGAARRPVAQWTVADVCAWLRSGPPGAPGSALLEAARSHAISGKALLRLTERRLEHMGLVPGSLRQALLQDILRLCLQQEMEDLLDITDE